MNQDLTPAKIIQLGMGFWGPKTLLSAVELGVFTEMAKGPLDAEALRQRLGLHPRSARDFLDALVALGMRRKAAGEIERLWQELKRLSPSVQPPGYTKRYSPRSFDRTNPAFAVTFCPAGTITVTS